MLPRSVGLIHLLPTELKLGSAKNALGCCLDVERDGDLPRERERPNRDADREGVPVVEAEGDRADCGCDTDVDGVFGRRDGGGSRRLASGDARRLRAGCLGEGGSEGDRTRPSLSIDVDMKV